MGKEGLPCDGGKALFHEFELVGDVQAGQDVDTGSGLPNKTSRRHWCLKSLIVFCGRNDLLLLLVVPVVLLVPVLVASSLLVLG